MNYKLTNHLTTISSFEVTEQNLFVLKNGGDLFCNDNLIYGGVESFLSLDSAVIAISENKTNFLSLEGELTRNIPKTILYHTLTNNSAVFSSNLNLDTFTLDYELISLASKERILDLGNLSFEEKIVRHYTNIFLHNHLVINCVDIATQQLKWSLNASDVGVSEFDKYLGFIDSRLLLACKSNTILEIDLPHGLITRSWKELSGFGIGNDYKDIIPEPSQFSLDHDQEKLIGTFNTYYIEIDLKSGEASYRDLKVELQSHHISDFRPFRDHPFDESHMYLTTHTYLPEYPNVDLGSVVALNRKTFKIDWMHTFTDASIGTNTPKITKTHLYQRDTEKNLYIFERVDHPA